MCVKKWLLIIVVLFIVMPSIWTQPTKIIGGGFGAKKSCGRDLVARVERICQSRGGHMTYTRVRRVRRGIVNECCMNKCTDHHIHGYCSKSSDSDTSIEAPVPVEVPESPIPQSQPFVRSINAENTVQPNIEVVTLSSVTEEPEHHYNDIYVTGNVKADFVEQIIRSLPRNSNDFQVGTVPPEYRISRYIPSRVRISNY